MEQSESILGYQRKIGELNREREKFAKKPDTPERDKQLAEIDNEIAATIALYKTNLIYKDKLLPVTFIGGIAVADQYRGHGIFKMFFSKLLNEYHKETALYILWTGDPEIYQAWEFFPFGYYFLHYRSYTAAVA